MGRAAALGPCSGGPSRLPKSLGLAERSALSRPPPRAVGMARLSSGGPRAAQARAESRGSPTVDALIIFDWFLKLQDTLELDKILWFFLQFCGLAYK